MIEWQAEYAALGIIESQAIQGVLAFARQVNSVEVRKVAEVGRAGPVRRYAFSGVASWSDFRSGSTLVEGNMELEFDQFGRIVRCQDSGKK